MRFAFRDVTRDVHPHCMHVLPLETAPPRKTLPWTIRKVFVVSAGLGSKSLTLQSYRTVSKVGLRGVPGSSPTEPEVRLQPSTIPTQFLELHGALRWLVA